LVPHFEHLVILGVVSVLVHHVLGVDFLHPRLRGQLQDGADQQVGRSDSYAGTPLALVHLLSTGQVVEVSAHDYLEDERAENHSEEPSVVQEFLKHVEVLATNFPAIDLVEKLEEEERVENVREVLSLVLSHFAISFSWNAELVLKSSNQTSEKHDENHNNNIPE